MTPLPIRAMFDTIKETAPFHLKDIAERAGLKRNNLNEWSAGRRTPPDEAFPPIADALEAKAAELRALAKQIRRRYPRP